MVHFAQAEIGELCSGGDRGSFAQAEIGGKCSGGDRGSNPPPPPKPLTSSGSCECHGLVHWTPAQPKVSPPRTTLTTTRASSSGRPPPHRKTCNPRVSDVPVWWRSETAVRKLAPAPRDIHPSIHPSADRTKVFADSAGRAPWCECRIRPRPRLKTTKFLSSARSAR
eukprot:gene24601-biopygen10445